MFCYMTTHKVQLSGRSYYAYLPTEWIKNNRLNKGSELRFNFVGNKLIIEPSLTNKKVVSINLKVNEYDVKILRQMITGLFIAGFDEFTLELNKPLNNELFRNLKELTSNIGLNMIDINNNSIKLNTNLSVNNIHKFVHDVIYKALNTVRMILNNENKELINHQEISLYYSRFIILRSLNRHLLSLNKLDIKPFEINLLRILAINLNRMIIHLRKINDKSFIKNIKHLFEKILVNYDKPNITQLNKLFTLINELKIDFVNNNEDYHKRRVTRCFEDIIIELINHYLITLSIED